jgi:hypothetical protein
MSNHINYYFEMHTIFIHTTVCINSYVRKNSNEFILNHVKSYLFILMHINSYDHLVIHVNSCLLIFKKNYTIFIYTTVRY